MASIIDDFLTKEECHMFINKQQLFANSIENHDKKNSDTSFQMLIDTGEFTDLVMNRITKWAKQQNGQIAKDAEKWSIYRKIRLVHYSAGQEKTMHRDTVFYDHQAKTVSTYTFIVYLNEEFKGGRTIAYPDADSVVHGKFNLRGFEDRIRNTHNVVITPKTGRAVLYPMNLVHEGERVEGEKWLIIFKLQMPYPA